MSSSLTTTAILEGLTTRQFGRPLYIRDQTSSTNDEAAALATQGAPEGASVVALVQTGGRGRRGRSWLSPPGGLWLSVVLRPQLSVAQWPLVGFAAAAGVAAAVEEVSGVRVGVKWPNDLLVDDRKVGGILVETRQAAAIVGIGLNANVPVEAFASDMRTTATSLLATLSRPVDLVGLTRGVLEQFERHYDLLNRDVPALLAQWRSRDLTLGQLVRITGAEDLEGVAEDVDETGALLVRTPASLQRVWTGEVSLRIMKAAQE